MTVEVNGSESVTGKVNKKKKMCVQRFERPGCLRVSSWTLRSPIWIIVEALKRTSVEQGLKHSRKKKKKHLEMPAALRSDRGRREL